MKDEERKLRESWGFKATHYLFVFVCGILAGIGIFTVLLLYLDTTNTDIAVLNNPTPRATCYGMEKLGLKIWLCARHSD